MADQHASMPPPPPSHQPMNAMKPAYAAKQPNYASTSAPATDAAATGKLAKSLKILNFVLLGFIVLAWVSWLIFLAGAHSDPTRAQTEAHSALARAFMASVTDT